MQAPIFDSHAHLISDDWETYPPSPMRGVNTWTSMPYSVTAESLLADMDRHGVPKVCIVQRGHVYGYDNRYIIDSGKRHPDRFIPVVILDAQNPDTPAYLKEIVAYHGVRGLRHAQSSPFHYDTAWMNAPTAMDSWRMAADLGIPVNIIISRRHLPWVLPALKMIAEEFSALSIIIDHLGTMWNYAHVEAERDRAAGRSPDLPGAPDFGLTDTVGIFERLPNVFIKMTEINIDRLLSNGIEPARVVRRFADTFGADRMLWGSDLGQSEWPYERKAATARAAADYLSAKERARFLFGTAAAVYSA